MARNIVMVTWPEESKAYQALAELRSSATDRINQAGVVQRGTDGRVQLRDGGSNVSGLGTLGGGVLGSLIGILGGPLGMLLGFSTGALFGSLIDVGNEADDTSVLAQLSARLKPGTTALFVDIEESNPAIVDTLVARSGGALVRRSYDAVYDEITSAEAAAQAAADEAARVIREQKKAERKAEREQKWEKTKAKFKTAFSGGD